MPTNNTGELARAAQDLQQDMAEVKSRQVSLARNRKGLFMMTQALTVFLTIFYVAWLIAVLLLLWKIWRNGATRAQRLEETLVDASLTTAKAARQASEAALLLAQQQERRTEP